MVPQHSRKAYIKIRKGFTFVELLLVVSIMSVLSITIYHTLANGINIWQKVRNLDEQQDVLISFDKMTYDLRNTLILKGIDFEGTQSNLKFPTQIHLQADPHSSFKSGESIDQIGEVEYYFDPRKKAFCRRQADYGQAINKRFDSGRVLVMPVENVSFSYYVQDEGKLVNKKKVADAVPVSVRVSVELKVSGEIEHFERLILIPVGGG